MIHIRLDDGVYGMGFEEAVSSQSQFPKIRT
jgi:hypothetical protein